jgi:hypothetical protein
MRVVAGSGVMRDLRQVELNRHIEMVARFIERTKVEGAAPRAITLVLRSANSGPAKALVSMKDELASAGIGAKAILAKLDPEEELRELFACLSELAQEVKPCELMRWARNPRLLDAHEQVTYGAVMCWTGDAMRRDADKRNALALFDEAESERARLGHLAFTAIWSVSSAVPERLLGSSTATLSGPHQARPDAPMTVVLGGFQGWPLVRH